MKLTDPKCIHCIMSKEENELITAYQKFVDFNPSLKSYIILMGYQTNYRRRKDLADFAGRVLAKQSSFDLEAMVLTFSFIRMHSLN